jgi:hypothetical protein
MQLDAIKGKPGSNYKGLKKGLLRLQTNKGTKDKSSIKCYKCSKKGYHVYNYNA